MLILTLEFGVTFDGGALVRAIALTAAGEAEFPLDPRCDIASDDDKVSSNSQLGSRSKVFHFRQNEGAPSVVFGPMSHTESNSFPNW